MKRTEVSNGSRAFKTLTTAKQTRNGKKGKERERGAEKSDREVEKK